MKKLLALVCMRSVSYTHLVLIVQSKDEKTVEPDSARYIYQRLRSVPPAEKELLWLENSGHIVLSLIHIFLIRNTLEKLFGEAVARHIRVLYGGSVKEDNAGQFKTCLLYTSRCV